MTKFANENSISPNGYGAYYLKNDTYDNNTGLDR